MAEADKNYALIDHTADVGVEVRGENFADLLVHAGEAVFSVITDLSTVEPSTCWEVRVAPGKPEEVMRSWLDELLSRFNRKDMLFSRFAVMVLDDNGIRAQAWGEVLDDSRHSLHTEIKGITYHQFQVRQNTAGTGWVARIILDV
ncbi:MAG: archease [Fidelibacterota bacterium]